MAQLKRRVQLRFIDHLSPQAGYLLEGVISDPPSTSVSSSHELPPQQNSPPSSSSNKNKTINESTEWYGEIVRIWCRVIERLREEVGKIEHRKDIVL